MEYNQLISCLFQFWGDDVLLARNIHRKRNQCRRHIDLAVMLIIKGTGHTVFSADGWKSETKLCIVSAKQCRKRLTPAGRIIGHSLEILLEGKADLLKITACCHDLRHRGNHCVNRTMIWAPAGQIWIKAVTHHGHGISPAFQHRKLRYHGLGFCQLIFTTIRHIYRTCTDRAVKHLHQAFLGTHIQSGQKI